MFSVTKYQFCVCEILNLDNVKWQDRTTREFLMKGITICFHVMQFDKSAFTFTELYNSHRAKGICVDYMSCYTKHQSMTA